MKAAADVNQAAKNGPTPLIASVTYRSKDCEEMIEDAEEIYSAGFRPTRPVCEYTHSPQELM